MIEEINCIFLNNNYKCDLENETEKCFTGICKDRIKIDDEKE